MELWYYPARRIVSLAPIENTFDDHGPAMKVTLICGHACIVTGTHDIERIKSRDVVRCFWCDRATLTPLHVRLWRWISRRTGWTRSGPT